MGAKQSHRKYNAHNACLSTIKKAQWENERDTRRTDLARAQLRLSSASLLAIPAKAWKWRPGEKWETGKILRVRFMQGTEEQKRAVKEHAVQWSLYANVGFRFDSLDHDAEIRITFNKNRGNWSAEGKDALHVPLKDATMNLVLQRHDSEIAKERKILHEFGHALGCKHEHKAPVGGIRWRKKVVYRELEGHYWSRDAIRENFFQHLNHTSTNYPQVDPRSIMLLPIPNCWTHGDYCVEWNDTLSGKDHNYIGYEYPGATVIFNPPKNDNILELNCEVLPPEGDDNSIEAVFNHVRRYKPHQPERYKYVKLILCYIRYSLAASNFPIILFVNGVQKWGESRTALNQPPTPAVFQAQDASCSIDASAALTNDSNSTIIRRAYLRHISTHTHFSIALNDNDEMSEENGNPSTMSCQDEFDISGQLKEGKNRLRIEYEPGVDTSAYSIQSLKVVYK